MITSPRVTVLSYAFFAGVERGRSAPSIDSAQELHDLAALPR
jgi:hypothetical protein